MTRPFAGLMALCLAAPALAGEVNCIFDRYEVSEGRKGSVDWQVVLINLGSRAEVDVIGSGDHSGTLATTAAGGWFNYTGSCRSGG